eukprot:TRINITY_DN150_c0_g1_i1.p1 TRINITY_DN150_c0_g1~~TRINITY_DN150_c0_g1_i1.p1  ORF type:complete len:568 (+),score=95.28 TRINITY_DN150_c0_g1_i1:196-1899(+)
MAAITTLSFLQLPSLPTQPIQTKLHSKILKSTSLSRLINGSRYCSITCSSANGRGPDFSDDNGVKSAERVLYEQKRAELAARIASGEFTVEHSGWVSSLRKGLSTLGVPREFLDFLWKDAQEEFPKIPLAKGALRVMRGQAFFIPLYELFLIYGGLFRLTFGPKSFLIVSDPAIAKHILRENPKAYSKGILAEILDFVMGKGLIPADGEIWRVRRRAIVPALHQKYVAAMIDLFGEASDRLCKTLDAAASDGEDAEMESLFSRLTLDVIGKAVFNYDFDSLTNDTGIVERMVEQEELQFHEEYMNEQDPSILHFLLASGDDVSSKQLRDDLMTMLIAGHETSAAVLTWTFYLLAKEPSVMVKLQNEVDSVLGDQFPTIEDMKKLKYTTRVINESLRLYPQPPVLIRRSLEDDVLGKYHIKRGEDIFISIWNLHRCPKHWVDAETFNPERWPLDGPNPNEINQNFSYLPFGGGPRKCVGDMFASFEIVVAVVMLVRRFNFQMALGAPPVEMTTGATIHTTEGLKMTVTRRTKPPIIPTLDKKMLIVDGDSPLNSRTTVSVPVGVSDGD